jgi:hypothetical protein
MEDLFDKTKPSSGITEIKAKVRVTWHRMKISERILAASGIDIATI